MLSLNSPQFVYMILILPSLCGITLIGDGIYKISNEDPGGIISIVFGLMFLVIVVIAILFFSTYLNRGV